MPPAPRSRFRRIARGIGYALASLLALVMLWLGLNLLVRAPMPAPLATESDLPALPPDEVNGWVAFRDGDKGRGPSLPSELTSLLADPSNGKGRWANITRRKDAITSAAWDPGVATWVALLEASIAKPAFVDATPLQVGAPFPGLSFFRAHQALELAILSRALSGDWPAAFRAVAHLAAADAQLAPSARTALSLMIGLGATQRTLALTEALFEGYASLASDPLRQPVAPSVFEALRKVLQDFRIERLPLHHAVQAEYVVVSRTLALLAQGTFGGEQSALERFSERVLLDQGRTIGLLNEDFGVALRFATESEGPEPQERIRRAQGALWWLHNPMGKLLADSSSLSYGPMLAKAKVQRREIVDTAAALARRCNALAAAGG